MRIYIAAVLAVAALALWWMTPSARDMSRRLRIYVAAILFAAVLVLAWMWPSDWRAATGIHYVLWIAICFVCEKLSLSTMSGIGTVTMADSAGLASIVLWGQGPACWIGAISTLVAHKLLLKKTWVRASFNAGQTAITTLISGAAFALCGGPIQGLEHLGRMATGELGALRLIPGVLALFVVYFAVNRALVTVAIAWSAERPYVRALREEWLYAERLFQDAAAFLLSPLMVLSFEAISATSAVPFVGYAGVVLFSAPLVLLNDSHRRYLDLEKAHLVVIHTERMAAKGEFAGSMAHNLNNIISGIKGKSQLIGKDVERGIYDNIARHMEVINDAVKRMESLARGMYESTHLELKPERVDLNALVQRVVDLVNTSKRFDGIEWDLKLAPQPAELRADPGQLHQVFMNLFANAADAMNEHNGNRAKRLMVSVIRDDRARQVRVQVLDNGPGIPQSNLAKVFEPHFSTKKTGNGFGLYSTYRIIELHKGRITAENVPDAGAMFTIVLPMKDPASWG
jgi:signal transduction histidine kinase